MRDCLCVVLFLKVAVTQIRGNWNDFPPYGGCFCGMGEEKGVLITALSNTMPHILLASMFSERRHPVASFRRGSC